MTRLWFKRRTVHEDCEERGLLVCHRLCSLQFEPNPGLDHWQLDTMMIISSDFREQQDKALRTTDLTRVDHPRTSQLTGHGRIAALKPISGPRWRFIP